MATTIFIRMNRIRMTQRETNIVPTIDQTFLTERIHLKWNRFTTRRAHHLIRQIDHQTVETAWGVEARFGLPYWDALIVAAAAP